jgi:hypothetical protein
METEKKKAPARAKRQKKQASLPERPVLLFTIVSRNKAELYADLLQAFESNIQMIMAAKGTAKTETLQLLGLVDTEKAVIVSILRHERAIAAMEMLEEKFRTIKNGKGVSFLVPVSSTIGVAIYQFLCNQRAYAPVSEEKKRGKQ